MISTAIGTLASLLHHIDRLTAILKSEKKLKVYDTRGEKRLKHIPTKFFISINNFYKHLKTLQKFY